MNRIALTGVSFFAMAGVAFADQGLPVQDQVVLSLQEEGWVTTNSADVRVYFNIVQQKETADDLKKEILAALANLAPKAEWYILSSRESKDQTGLNRWNVSANARLAESAIAGLYDKAESISRPGFKMGVSQIDFSPTLDETNALKANLRSRIYTKAKEEAERLTTAIGGAAYQVRMVNFNPNFAAQPTPMYKDMAMQRVSSTMESSGGSGGGSKMPVSEKHSLTATIILGRSSDNIEK